MNTLFILISTKNARECCKQDKTMPTSSSNQHMPRICALKEWSHVAG